VKGWKHPPDRAIVFTAILIGLLVLFAAMQYRWVGQVRDAERERLQESLQTGVSRLCRDFDREITRAFLFFQVRSDPKAEEPKPYAALYRRWLATSEHPRLIKDMFVVARDGTETLTLERVNPDSGEPDRADWPSELENLRDRIRSDYENRAGLVPVIKGVGDPIAESVPALVIPPSSLVLVQQSQHQVDLSRLTEHLSRLTERIAASRSQEYVILTLNRDYLSKEFLPSLVRQHLSSGGQLDYRLAILGRGDSTVIYESESDSARAATINPDASSNLFGLRLDDITDIVSRDSHESGTSARRVSINLFRSKAEGALAARADEGRWQLVVKHRAGSLDAMVAGVRRRNLAASFGILVLLALSVVLLVASTSRAQRLARQQMEFVAGVSHELRTPLAVIRSAGQNLADRIARDPEQVARYGALIESEGRRLTDMVEQVLDLSGIQSGRKAYTLREVELGDILNNALRACARQAAGGEFQIEQDLEEPLPAVRADAGALSQAIENLLTNAMKYAGSSRIIHLTAREQRQHGSSEVLVSVRDEGLGIDPLDLPHIFEPFYRGRVAVDEQIHGNGLGLCLVRQIVEAHGGRTTVDSAPGRGSTFTIHIPAGRSHPNNGQGGGSS
jgi:signal transduction histidine kinase